MDSIIAVTCVGVLILWFGGTVVRTASRNPERAWVMGVIMVFLAATRFRKRDASASLRGELDAQVLFELTLYLAVAIIIGALWLRWHETLRTRRFTASQWSCVAFCALAVISSMWSAATVFTLVRAFQATILFGLAVAGLGLFQTETVAVKISRVAVGYVLIMFALRLSSVALRGNAGYLLTGRFRWLSNHPIEVAIYCGLAALFVTAEYLYSRNSKRPTVWAVPVFAILLFIIFLTRSRAPILTFLVVIGLVVSARLLRVRISRFAITGSLFFALLFPLVDLDSVFARAFNFASRNKLLNVFLLREQSQENLRGLTGRIEMWDDAGAIFKERPLLGYGYQASRRELQNVAPWLGHAHNAILQVSLDLGIVGALLLLIPFLFCTINLLRRTGIEDGNWWAPAFGATGIFLLLQSATDPSFAGPPGPKLFLAFICVNAAAFGTEEDTPENVPLPRPPLIN